MGEAARDRAAARERRRHADQATASQQLAAIIIRTQAEFIGSTDRLHAFAVLLDDTVRFIGASHAALVEQGATGGVVVARSRLGAAEVPASEADLVLPLRQDDSEIGSLLLWTAGDPLGEAQAEALRPITALLAQLLDVFRTTRQRREDQRSIARLSQVAQQMHNGMIITDSSGRIEWANEAFIREVQVAPEQVLGRRLEDFTEHWLPDGGDSEHLTSHLNSATPFSGEYRMAADRRDREHWIRVTASPFLAEDGAPEGLIITTIDISERRRIERMKEDFVSTVSHELRTPLTSISGALSLLAGGVGGELSPAAEEMLSIAHRNSRRLSRLVDDLLDLDKLAAGKLRIDLEVRPVMDLIDDACIENQVYADGFDVHIECTQRVANARIEVDPQRFQQVLRNLLSNAVKFSDPGGLVEVRVWTDELTVTVEVRDHGAGIPAGFQHEVFERFTQADTGQRGRIGTGLGLAISKELVERMGGTIGFTSTEGVGSSFRIALPRARAKAGA